MVTLRISFCLVSSGLANPSNISVAAWTTMQGVWSGHVSIHGGTVKEDVAAAVCSEHTKHTAFILALPVCPADACSETPPGSGNLS